MSSPEESIALPVEIPLEVLSDDALEGIIESFILREGTDYGREEASYAVKVQQIRKQLQTGHVRIVFDPQSESVTMLTENEWRKVERQSVQNLQNQE